MFTRRLFENSFLTIHHVTYLADSQDRELVTEARILVTDHNGATIITTKVGDDV